MSQCQNVLMYFYLYSGNIETNYDQNRRFEVLLHTDLIIFI